MPEGKDILYMYPVTEGGDPRIVLTDSSNNLKNSQKEIAALLEKIRENFKGQQIDGGIELTIKNSDGFLGNYIGKTKVLMGLEDFYIPGTFNVQGFNIKTIIDRGFRAGDTALEKIKGYLREQFELREGKYKP